MLTFLVNPSYNSTKYSGDGRTSTNGESRDLNRIRESTELLLVSRHLRLLLLLLLLQLLLLLLLLLLSISGGSEYGEHEITLVTPGLDRIHESLVLQSANTRGVRHYAHRPRGVETSWTLQMPLVTVGEGMALSLRPLQTLLHARVLDEVHLPPADEDTVINILGYLPLSELLYSHSSY
jgi:hypothetical protein